MELVHKLDMAVIFLTVGILIVSFGYVRPLAIAPLDELETYNSNVLFLIDKADYILVDDDIDFSSPVKYLVGEDRVIKLEPGQYYWRAFGPLGESEVRSITIKSLVELKIEKNGERVLGEDTLEEGDEWKVVNVGNENLDVEVYQNGSYIETRGVLVGDSFTSGSDKFVGGKS